MNIAGCLKEALLQTRCGDRHMGFAAGYLLLSVDVFVGHVGVRSSGIVANFNLPNTAWPTFVNNLSVRRPLGVEQSVKHIVLLSSREWRGV